MIQLEETLETIRFFDANAKRYQADTDSKLDLDALRHFSQMVLEGNSNRESPPKVLDAGCGAGRDLEYLFNQGFEVEGFDGSEALLSLARERLEEKKVHLWKQNLIFLSLKKSRYEGIWCHQTLGHLPATGWQRVLGEFFSALMPKGILFLSMEEGSGYEDLSWDEEMSGAHHEIHAPSDTKPLRQRIYRYPPNEVASLIRQSGFQIRLHGKVEGRKHPMHGFLAQRI